MSARSVFLLLTLLFITVATSEGNVSNCYLRLSSSDSETQRANRKLIESYGARVIHEFPATGEFICWMALSQYDLLIQESAITGQQHDQSYTTSSHKTTNSIGEFCWMELQSPDPTPPPEQPQGVTICGTSQRETVERELWLSAPPPADRNISLDQMFSTNYLVGKTAICVILPEYPGGETWTTYEEDVAIAYAVDACEALSNAGYDRNVDVTWIYEIHRAVPVDEEPINVNRPNYEILSLSWNFGWIDDAFQHLGYGSGWSGIFANGNRLRQQYQTDWGVAVFVVMNQNELSFPNGAAGYAQKYWPPGSVTEQYRSPFCVSTFYPGGGVADRSQYVIAHEMLHTFGAADESDCSDCEEAYGFLYHPNLNCEGCTGSPEDCIMRGIDYHYALCEHTVRHIGWSDSDGDGHPDAIDLHNPSWTYIDEVQPGDLVRAHTTGGSLIRNICVTENKMDTDPWGNAVFFDCANNQSQAMADNLYYVTVNGGNQRTDRPKPYAGGPLPKLHSIEHDGNTGSLRWDIADSWCMVDLEIYSGESHCGEPARESMVARPLWNQFQRATPESDFQSVDVSNLGCDPCFALFRVWRPDGVNLEPIGFYYENDPDADGILGTDDICPYTYNPEQDPDALREWSEVFEESNGFYQVNAVQPMFDGGYLVAGQVENWAPECYYHLWKVDACGSIAWDEPCCGPFLKSSVADQSDSDGPSSPDDRGYSFKHPIIEPTADSGFILLTNEQGFTLVKLDKYGNQEWYKFPTSGYFGFSVHQTSTGGYVIAMQGDSPLKPSVLWLDANGNFLRKVSIGETWYYPQAMDARETSDGGTICVTDWPTGGANGTDIRVVKYGDAYNVQWDHTFGGADEDVPITVFEVLGTGYAIAGNVYSPSVSYNTRLMMINSTGTQVLWDAIYDTPDVEGLTCATTTDDGGYLLAGSADGSGTVGVDCSVRKVDANGVEQWLQTYDALDNEVAGSIVATDDGGFIVGGQSFSFSSPSNLGGLVVKGMPPTCCVDFRGNVDYDPNDQIDMSDLVALVDYMFTGGLAPECWSEANVDGIGPDDDSGIDMSDLVYLVDFMFTGGPPPPACP